MNNEAVNVEDLGELSDRDLDERFRDVMNECWHSPLVICGYNYSSQVDILKEIDPIAYREAFNNWLDAEISEGEILEVAGEYYAN